MYHVAVLLLANFAFFSHSLACFYCPHPNHYPKKSLACHRALLRHVRWRWFPFQPRRHRLGRAPLTHSSWMHASTCSVGWCMRSSTRTRRTSAAQWFKTSPTRMPHCVFAPLLRPSSFLYLACLLFFFFLHLLFFFLTLLMQWPMLYINIMHKKKLMG